MPVSATAARIYVNVPDALSRLNQVALDTTYAGIIGLNATGVRITVPWKSVQPSGAEYFTWAATDLAVNRALAANLRVMLVLAPPRPYWTSWASQATAHFSAFAAAAATRYRARGVGLTAANAAKSVAEYQIWDAPNVLSSWRGAVATVAADYGALLKSASVAIKGAQPSAVVVFGALRAINATTTATVPGPLGGPLLAKTVKVDVEPSEFLSEIYTSIAPHFDVLAYDPLSVTIEQKPFPPAPSGDSISGHDWLYASMVSGGKNARAAVVATRGARGAVSRAATIVQPSAKKVYWTSVGYELAQFTQYQQALYLDTIRRLAQTRPEVTGIGVLSLRDFLV
jgi:hypothetical protein